jgi:hypothetical protein
MERGDKVVVEKQSNRKHGGQLRRWGCPCGIEARGAEDLDIVCGRCHERFTQQLRWDRVEDAEAALVLQTAVLDLWMKLKVQSGKALSAHLVGSATPPVVSPSTVTAPPPKTGRYRALKGQNGWYVAWVLGDNGNLVPRSHGYLSEPVAKQEAERLNELEKKKAHA